MSSNHRSQPRTSPAGDRGRGEAWFAGQMALLAAIALAPRRVRGLPNWPASLRWPSRIAGAICATAGSILALAGARALGRNLTPYPRPRHQAALVQQGIYGVTRNPIYGGLALGAVGWSLLRGSMPSLVLSAALAVFLDQKVRREEAWLAQTFPEFDQYRRRVPRWLG